MSTSIADHKQIAEAILRWKPQCIIVDSDPGSAGHERSWADAAAIRRAHPDLPVLMFTADPAATAEAEAGTSARSRAAHTRAFSISRSLSLHSGIE